jgi:hypothetical protein
MFCVRLPFQKPESKPKLLSAPNASNSKAALAKEGTDEDFYTLFQRVNANTLSEKDMAKLIVAMKEVTSSDDFSDFYALSALVTVVSFFKRKFFRTPFFD